MIQMKNIHCTFNNHCPNNLNFLFLPNITRRAGIIPFIVDDNNETYILLGLSKGSDPVWSDLGGRSEENETTLQTAVREFGEESRYVLPINLNNMTKILIDNNNKNIIDQVLLIIEVDSNDYNININDSFQNTIPKTKYEDEMSILQWIPYNMFLTMDGLSRSMIHVRNILNESISI